MVEAEEELRTTSDEVVSVCSAETVLRLVVSLFEVFYLNLVNYRGKVPFLNKPSAKSNTKYLQLA